MSFFDPAYKKIALKAPPEFGIFMSSIDPWIIERLRAGDVPSNGFDMSRNIIYAGVLAAMPEKFGSVSFDCMEFASRTARTAVASYPKNLWHVVSSIMEDITSS